MTDYKIIQTINGPEDVKKLSMEQLEELASEIREALFNRLTKIGGHFGPNFGMVEAEIAMHYVFSSPKDKFIFDVSHQSYPHKILTGRKNGYISDEHFSEDSGYTNPEESEHDFFNVGHTSTSVSLATGLAKARDIKGDKENIIAIIGDAVDDLLEMYIYMCYCHNQEISIKGFCLLSGISRDTIHSWGNSNTRAYIYKDLQGNIISDIAVTRFR